jgi:hypothetical protein
MQVIVICENDKAVRQHLATLAKAIRAKFSATAYQGDFENTVTGETFGDRLQVGTTATINQVRYLLVANVLISRNDGGKVSIRVSAWSLSGNTGKPVGTWVIRRTALTGVTLTDKGFRRRIGNTYSPVDMAQRVTVYLNQAKALLKDEFYGRPVVTVHTNREGDNPYDTTESHLLPFGGIDGVMARLNK